jgi:hypothetical protein
LSDRGKERKRERPVVEEKSLEGLARDGSRMGNLCGGLMQLLFDRRLLVAWRRRGLAVVVGEIILTNLRGRVVGRFSAGAPCPQETSRLREKSKQGKRDEQQTSGGVSAMGTERINVEELHQELLGSPSHHPKEGKTLRCRQELPPVASGSRVRTRRVRTRSDSPAFLSSLQ